MEIHQLTYFVAVAETENFSRAAKRIHAEGHLGALEGVGDTAANLQTDRTVQSLRRKSGQVRFGVTSS